MIGATQHSAVPVWQAAVQEPVAFATVLLVIVTAGLWISTFLLWRATVKLAKDAKEGAATQTDKMERSIGEAARAAAAMEQFALSMKSNAEKMAESVRMQQRHGEMQLRAYLCLQHVRMDEIVPAGGPLRITFPLENTGSTPANQFIVHWAWEATADEPTSKFFNTTLNKYPLPDAWDYSIGPRHVKEISEKINIGADWRQKVLANEMKFYVLGRIHYRDAFDAKRTTEFFYCYTNDLPNHLGQVNVHNRID